ncbi:unnamed protein product [Timema podura]|uniref:RNase NYN domain-containing protein n=1 Tax=Timema podura TaxID=61482 RepID=A0ABN7P8A2_TIMPD|nr:unnamed protein product [Timema podura]
MYVCCRHGNGSDFSYRGLQICITYFVKRGHKVMAFLPQHRKCGLSTKNKQILTQMEKEGHLVFTPSRRVDQRLVVPYDDWFIVQCAAVLEGVIVSNDNYRDLLASNSALSKAIKERLLMYTWVGNLLMFPNDPLGRYGPTLDKFLRFP